MAKKFKNSKKSADKESKKKQHTITFKSVTLAEKQRKLFNEIKENKITVVTGPAGTSKTFTACFTALKILKSGFSTKIIISKPTETIGSHQLGALPGTLDEKLAVYQECFIHNFSEIIDEFDLEILLDNRTIEFKPVQFLRGVTFKNAVIIIDEFQSFDLKELMAIVTRFGRPNCKMIFIGDVNQNDINKKYMGMSAFLEILDGLEEVSLFKFEKEDIVRDPLLIKIVENYENLKQTIQNKKNT